MVDMVLDLFFKLGVDLEWVFKFFSRIFIYFNFGGLGWNFFVFLVYFDGNESDSLLKNSVFDRRGSNFLVILYGENLNSIFIKSEEDVGGLDKLGFLIVLRFFKMYFMDFFLIYSMVIIMLFFFIFYSNFFCCVGGFFCCVWEFCRIFWFFVSIVDVLFIVMKKMVWILIGFNGFEKDEICFRGKERWCLLGKEKEK